MLNDVRYLRKQFFYKFLIFFLGSSLVFSCQSPQNGKKGESKIAQERYLSLSLTSEVSSLDPRLGMDNTSEHVINMLFEGLMHINEKAEVEPALLESFSLSADKKVYLLSLKESAWSNGMPVTAYDFEYAWKNNIDSNHAGRSTAVHYFYVIKNMQRYMQKSCSLEDVGIKALDSKTLRVELENPVPYFLESLAVHAFFPICKAIDEQHPGWSSKVGKEFVCNGPFYLEKHKYNNEILVIRNPLYWDAKNVQLKGIKISIIKDNSTRLSLFEKNAIDWIGKPLARIPLDAIALLKKQNKIETFPSRGVYWYFINTEKFPFSNKKIRQAFAYAINRREITDYVLQESEKPAYGLFSAKAALQQEPYFQDNNPEKASQLFKEALEELGVTKEELPEIILSYNSDDVHQNISQVIQQQLNKVLGVKVHLRHFEWKIHYANMIQGDYDLGGISWQPWLKDPIFMLQIFRNKLDGINISRWENTQYTALLVASDQEIDEEKRRELLHQAEAILMEEMPIIPIYFMSSTYAKNKNLQNVKISDLNMIDFRGSFFEEESTR